jgi:hypothetical protein
MVNFEIGKSYVYRQNAKGMKLTWTVIARTANTIVLKNRTFGEIKRNIVYLDSVQNEKMEAVRIFKKDKFSMMSACNYED